MTEPEGVTRCVPSIPDRPGLFVAAALAATVPAGSLALAQELPPVDQSQTKAQPAATGEVSTTMAATTALRPRRPRGRTSRA
jgi:hypothetical protein